jgi:hypothetical protein
MSENIDSLEPESEEGFDMQKESVVRKKEKPSSDDHMPENYSPMHEQRIDRDYAKGTELNQSEGVQGDIPEPDFTPESPLFTDVEFNEIPANETGAKTGKNEKGKQPSEPYNPELEQLSKKEQKEAAEMAAEQVIDIYLEYKPKLFRWIGKVPKRKVEKMVLDGKLDMDMKMEFPDGTFTIRERFDTLHELTEEAFVTPPEFKDKVLPPLTRIFMKKGVGLTDEQFLMVEFGKDFISSAVELAQIKQATYQWLRYASDVKLQFDLQKKELEEKIKTQYGIKDNVPGQNTVPPQPKPQPQPEIVHQPAASQINNVESPKKEEAKKNEVIEYEVHYEEVKTDKKPDAISTTTVNAGDNKSEEITSEIVDEGEVKVFE